MRVLWESNSRVKRLAAEGVIKDEDVLARTTTDNFPAGGVSSKSRTIVSALTSLDVVIKSNVKNASIE